jgi:hypothetical protein
MPLPSARYYAKRRNVGGPSTRARVLASDKPSAGVVILGDLCPELTANQRPVCVCSKPMQVRRSNRLSVFWSCPRFPVCKFTKPIDQQRFLAYIGKRDAKGIGKW